MLVESLSQTALIKQFARSVGFDVIGIAPADRSRHEAYLRAWLDSGQAGDMDYLARRLAERIDPSKYLPGVRSVVCVAVNYHVPLEPAPPGHGRIARYAQGDDYHVAIQDQLYDLADWMRATFPEAQTRCATDSAPVLEREFATRAGIGWIGKNTCVIRPGMGSWLLLGEVLTTLELEPDSPVADYCGTCTRCIDACPTDAITAPYQLNASRCISYLTIEHRGEVSGQLQSGVGNWLAGCDICQDVCPHNAHAPTAMADWLQPRVASNSIDPNEILNWSPEQYYAATRRSALRRVKLPMFQRNARMVLANQEKE